MDRHDPSSSIEKDSVRLTAKKGPKGGALPPLTQDFGPRTHSAPEGTGRGEGGQQHASSEEAEALVMTALNKARSLQDKNKKLGAAERNLLQSPFAQPQVVKQIQDGGKTSPTH